MPQMQPMNWLILYSFSWMMILLIMMNIYFSPLLSIQGEEKEEKASKSEFNNMW